MAALTCKATVRFKGFTRANLRILNGLLVVAERTTDVARIVITSANDSRHSRRSQHYKNAAIDVRSRNFTNAAARNRFIARITRNLGSRFYVLYEGHGTPNAHIHIQQRKGTTYTGSLT